MKDMMKKLVSFVTCVSLAFCTCAAASADVLTERYSDDAVNIDEIPEITVIPPSAAFSAMPCEIAASDTETSLSAGAEAPCAVEITFDFSYETADVPESDTNDTPDEAFKLFYGDIDLDMTITSDDALAALRISIFGGNSDKCILADIDGDSCVTSADSLEILRMSIMESSESLKEYIVPAVEQTKEKLSELVSLIRDSVKLPDESITDGARKAAEELYEKLGGAEIKTVIEEITEKLFAKNIEK